jgi:thiamine-phosphate pyrophosphorylase
MTELLVSIGQEISDFIPDTEADLKTELGSIFSVNKLSKSRTVIAENPKKALNLCAAALSIIGIGDASNEKAKEILSKIDHYFSLQIRLSIRNKMNGIYIIVDPEATNSVDVYDMTKSSLEGGVKVVQYRDKLNDRAPFLENCYKIKELCDQYNAAFVVNDAVDIAKLTEADFLHVGQSDMPVEEARQILKPAQCIGRSNGGVLESTESEEFGVDYLAVGAIYATSTMGKSARNPLGPSMITKVKSQTGLPIVAIGGITIENLPDVIQAGADSVCMVSAITMSEDPEASARKLVNIWDTFK